MNSPVHFVPGTMCNHRLWTRLLSHLSSVDARFSDPANASTLDKMIADVASEVPRDSHLVGFSFGGYLAAEAVLRHQLPVASLTLIATAIQGLPDHEKELRRSNASLLRRSEYRGMSTKRLQKFLHPNNLHDDEYRQTIFKMEKELGQDILSRQLLLSLDRRDLLPVLKKIPCPVFLISAADDKLVDNSRVKEGIRQSPVRHTQIQSTDTVTGHMIPLEAPQLLARILSKNFDSIK